MAYFTICDNILINFDSHNSNNDNGIFKACENNLGIVTNVEKEIKGAKESEEHKADNPARPPDNIGNVLIGKSSEQGTKSPLLKDGKVGIGTTGPTSTLHVIGTGNFSSNLYAGSCTGTNKLCTDIAELFPAEKDVKEGDVVCLKSSGKAGHCDKEFDSKVLGVISTAPAIIIEGSSIVLGQGNYSNSDEKLPIALKGRVPVKAVCSTPISQGDLLVSAAKKGYAMKLNLDSNISWKQATGTSLGKALEPCESGEKTIMAWVG